MNKEMDHEKIKNKGYESPSDLIVEKINFTEEGLKKVAMELNISFLEVCRGLGVDDNRVFEKNDFSPKEDYLTDIQIKRIFGGHVYSTEDELFFRSSAVVISKALHDCDNASSVDEARKALEVLDGVLIKKIEEVNTVYQLSMLYYTARDCSKAKEPALKKIYGLLNS